jgi:hypothetical protein
MANTYTLIASNTVGSGGAASIDFTSIPQTYTDLLVKTSMRGSAVDTWIQVKVTFNGSTTGYTNKNLLGSGSAASSSTNNFTDSIGRGMLSEGTSYTANIFASSDFYIPNYTSSNYKSTSSEATTENNATANTTVLDAGLWSNTAAINQVTLTSDSGNFAQYSTAYLYGISNS